MQILFLILFLLFPSIVYSAPATTLSITPSATDATTITASDENTRNSAVSTWANAHDHNDIDQTANTLAVGDAAAGNKTITANNADTNKPFIRYDDTNDRWVSSRNGTTIETLTVMTGATNTNFVLPQTAPLGSLLYGLGNSWALLSAGSNEQVLRISGGGIPAWTTLPVAVGSFTRDTTIASGTQAVTGLTFTPRAVIFLGIQNSSREMSIGLDMQSASAVIIDDPNSAGTYTQDDVNSIYDYESVGNTYTGEISSFESNGFTVTWTKTGTPTGTYNIKYLAFR